ncbi:MAG: apolipoprotein N-acyltransferase [Planctomycetota bacterium]
MPEGKTRTRKTYTGPHWLTILILLSFSCLLQALAFHPAEAWPLAWVALVPWVVVIARLRWLKATLWSLLLGYVFFFSGANWLTEVHIGALLLLAAPLAAFYAFFGLLLNIMGRRGRLPLTLAVPVAWVTVEFLRSFVLTGFPWLYLAHTQYRLLALIQISDITGAYGVSLIVAMFNGLLADILLSRFGKSPFRLSKARLAVQGAITVALIAGAAVYGTFRLAQVRAEMRPGPRLLIIQPNIPQELKSDRELNRDVFKDCLDMTVTAFAKAKDEGEPPDLVVWPETILPPRWDTNNDGEEEFVNEEVKKKVKGLIDYVKCPLFSGGVHVNDEPRVIHWWHPTKKKYVEDSLPYTEVHNSVYYFDTKAGQMARYDKMHLVPYGEYIALQDVFPFIRGGIRHFAGFVRELEAGAPDQQTVFTLPSRDGSNRYTFCAPICYEIIFPDLVAKMVSEDGSKKDAQFIINVSNDGWFKESAELEQTTVIAAFRAVENRVGVVRATNTGISGFIRPDGLLVWEKDFLRDAITGEMKSVGGTIQRPVYVSGILTVYSRVKDVFAIVTSAVCGLLFVVSLTGMVRAGKSAS